LPEEWVSSGRVTAVGGQTARDVDDVGALTDRGGHVLVQSKVGLRRGTTATSPLAKAIEQVVRQYLRGVPADPEDGRVGREVDPGRDRLIIVTDERSPASVRVGLVQAVDALACLPAELPFTDVQGDSDLIAARDTVLELLRSRWEAEAGQRPTDAVLRPLLRVFRIRVVRLDEGNSDWNRAVELLETVLDDPSRSRSAWSVLVSRCMALAENRRWATRDVLADGLEHEGFALGSDPDYARDVATLRAASRSRVEALRNDIQVPAPEGAVRLSREVQPLLADAEGNLVLVGAAGVGKTGLILQVAHTLAEAGEDVLFLPADALAGRAAEARGELGISADVLDVLRGWRGVGRGTLIIDGLDITKLSEPSRWLLELVRGLAGSRWRVLATVRTYSLRYGPQWREAFRGDPVNSQHQVHDLAGVHHLLVDDLTDEELGPLIAASPSLAALLGSAPPALMRLLRSPFNLRLAAELLASEPLLSLGSIRTRNDLLREYWERRVMGAVDRRGRQRTLACLTAQMITARRPRMADPEAALDPALYPAFEGLLTDDVLREDPREPWAAATTVGFSHPIMFDYAVAQLILGRPGQPLFLLEKLAADPDLAVIARPSLDLHLAAIWHSDTTRDVFWTLAIQLDRDGHGHALASLAAAGTCVQESLADGDLDPLIAMCERRGPMAAQTDDARRLLAQIAGVMLAREITPSQRRAAVPVLASAAARLAITAEASGDVGLALLVTVVLHRLKAAGGSEQDAVAAHLDEAAATSMRVALADPAGAGRASLAGRAAELVADAIIRDPAAYDSLIGHLCDRAVFDAWNVIVIEPLIRKLPALARATPTCASELVLTAWTYEVTNDTPTQIGASRILSLGTSTGDELEMARWSTGAAFPEWLTTAPAHAIGVYLELLSRRAPPWPTTHQAGEPPRVRRSESLMGSGGHRALLDMARALATFLASQAASSNGEPRAVSLTGPLDQLAEGLSHHEVWNILLDAATAAAASLGIAFLPLLEQGQLLEHPATLASAARLLAAISPLLDRATHQRTEQRVLAIRNCTDPSNDSAAQDLVDLLIGCLDADKIQEPAIAARLVRQRQFVIFGVTGAGGAATA
jgi:hypothetical protein